MSVINYSDLDKDILKYALEGNEIRSVGEPIARQLKKIAELFNQGVQIVDGLIKRLEDEIAFLCQKRDEISEKLSHERYVLKNLPTTREETYVTINDHGEKVTRTRTVPANQEIRDATIKKISFYEHTIDEIGKRIEQLSAAVERCRNSASCFSQGYSECNSVNSALTECQEKFLKTCYEVSKLLSSADVAISSYLNVSISTTRSATVSHIRRK